MYYVRNHSTDDTFNVSNLSSVARLITNWGFPKVRDYSALVFSLNNELSKDCSTFSPIMVFSPNYKNFPGSDLLPIWHLAHGGCDQSTEDAYSSMAPDPTPIFERPVFALLLICYFPLEFWLWTMFVITTCHLRLHFAYAINKR